MKKSKISRIILSLCMICVLVITSLLVACTAEKETTTATTTQTATEIATATATATATETATETLKAMRLSLAYHFPSTAGTAGVLEAWAAKIEEETDGRISFDVYPAASLVASGDQYEACVGGIADVIFTSIDTEPAAWPLNQVLNQPAVGVPIGAASSAFYKEIYDALPELKAELDDIKVLIQWRTLSETNIHTTGKEVRLPADTVGQKIIAIGGFVEFLKVIGATPLAIAPTEHYMALERGMADGVMIPYTVMNIHGVTELVTYHLSLDLAGPAFMLIMNLDKWNSLAPSDQQLFEEANEWAVAEFVKASDADMIRVFEKMEELGHTVVDPTPEEFKIWQETSLAMSDTWIEENEANGPAQEIFDTVTEIAEKYR